MVYTKGQWPDNICSGEIYYGRANNYNGFYLADSSHGIPTFGSVSPSNLPTIRGQYVNVFNYPEQTEQIAAELVKRWNAYPTIVDVIRQLHEYANNPTHSPNMNEDSRTFVIAMTRAAIEKLNEN